MIKLFYNLLFPVTFYAEIHYRLFPGFPSFLFRPYPEIIIDIPHRFQREKLPVFLIIKDADKYPVTINSICLLHNGNSITINSSDIEVKKKWQWQLFEIEHNFHSYKKNEKNEKMKNSVEKFFIKIKFTSIKTGKKYTKINDSYPGKNKKPFIVYPSAYDLPGKNFCWWGDIHTHSNFTDDQIEFGSPLPFLHTAASKIGLDFAALTDHSYDLDDHPENYLKNDPNHPKFSNMIKQINELNEYPVFIPGEEVSWGNCKNENIHALIINPQKLYEGYGDSGERYFINSPTHKMDNEIKNINKKEEIIIAAHPLKEINKSQRFFLKRGKWHKKDLMHPAIHSWQILNGKLDNGFLNGQKKWIKALLAGKKIFITAGNDAHGNLNIFRQVKIPFINIENSYLHQFGYFKTGLIHNNFVLNKNNILKLIKQGRMIISSGPFADFSIKINEAIFFIGDTINNENIRNNLSFNLRFHSSPEYGSLFEIRLIYGNLNKKNEKTIFHYENKSQDAIFEYNHSLEFDSNNEFASAYFRIECKTVTGHFVLSNPIWYEK